MGGAKVLGRSDEIGSLEVGKLADIAVWRLDTLAHIDIVDPIAALVLGAPPRLELLLVGGRPVVEQGGDDGSTRTAMPPGCETPAGRCWPGPGEPQLRNRTELLTSPIRVRGHRG